MTFNKIIRKEIFTENFNDFKQDNELIFPESGIVVIYGPNGVGKSSLASIFAGEQGTEFDLVLDGDNFRNNRCAFRFHVINDQNGRNIIQGSTEDFLLGDNIRREYDLKKAIDAGFEQLFNAVVKFQSSNQILKSLKRMLFCSREYVIKNLRFIFLI